MTWGQILAATLLELWWQTTRLAVMISALETFLYFTLFWYSENSRFFSRNITASIHFLIFMVFSTVFVAEVRTEWTVLIWLEKMLSGKSWLPTQRLEVGWWWWGTIWSRTEERNSCVNKQQLFFSHIGTINPSQQNSSKQNLVKETWTPLQQPQIFLLLQILVLSHRTKLNGFSSLEKMNLNHFPASNSLCHCSPRINRSPESMKRHLSHLCTAGSFPTWLVIANENNVGSTLIKLRYFPEESTNYILLCSIYSLANSLGST